MENRAVKVEVAQKPGADRVIVAAKSKQPIAHLQAEIVHMLNKMLGLQVDSFLILKAVLMLF
jgi:hypothetical protein